MLKHGVRYFAVTAITIMSVTALTALGASGASAASAAPAHQISQVRMVSSLADIPSAGAAKMVGGKLELPAQTAADCTVVYVKSSSGNLYLTAEGLNNVVEATSGSRDCWSTPPVGDTGQIIYSGSGRCLAQNAELNRAVMQNCSNVSWQEWISVGDAYFNLWAVDHSKDDCALLATQALTSGTYVYATGCLASQWSTWYT